MQQTPQTKNSVSLTAFIKNYIGYIIILFILGLLTNVITLLIPRLIANSIDSYVNNDFDINASIYIFAFTLLAILLFSLAQLVIGVVAAERIGKDLRTRIITKVSNLSFRKVNEISTERILTNATSDVEAVKRFISEALPYVFSAVVLLIGSIISVLTLNASLALPVLLILPVIVILSWFIFSRLGKYFGLSQGVIDTLNRVITENILAAPLIRVLSSQKYENNKFDTPNFEAKKIGITILKSFAFFFPVIFGISNLAIIIILWQGGIKVINNELTLGEFSAFFAYIQTLIFPILIFGFIGESIGKAFASFARIATILESDEDKNSGTITKEITGAISLEQVSYILEDKPILKDINIQIKPGTRNGIIGPTASGKTQLLHLMVNLIQPTTGTVKIDGNPIDEFQKETLYKQIGLVFQDSILFNTTIRENIAFRENISDEAFNKAVQTAEISDFVSSLPEGMETPVSERGSRLSGGQKQRITLARALALNPKILLLDDFTARVDQNTEKRIMQNLFTNYPEMTIVMISQKISSVQNFDQVILVMEGEVVASGTHEKLLKKSLEYKLIFDSQQSTEEN